MQIKNFYKYQYVIFKTANLTNILQSGLPIQNPNCCSLYFAPIVIRTLKKPYILYQVVLINLTRIKKRIRDCFFLLTEIHCAHHSYTSRLAVGNLSKTPKLRMIAW